MGPQAAKIAALLSYLGATTFFMLAYQGVIRTETTHVNVHVGNQLMYFTDLMLSVKGKPKGGSSPRRVIPGAANHHPSAPEVHPPAAAMMFRTLGEDEPEGLR